MTDLQNTPAILSQHSYSAQAARYNTGWGARLKGCGWSSCTGHHGPPHVQQVIPNAAHNANQDNPVFTNQAILTFLQKHVSA